ncbi:TPA: hypothetical protein MEW82_005502 [Klebsiella pneumoniae]|nr:hypothetical protein [Klebsiella pneumoniae]HBW3090923.1 hypothetical protein [Klebsiella pneumoniae]
MASNDASPSDGPTANLVPEVNNEVMALEPVVGAAIAAPVAGQQNVIDPWIRNNFVQAPGGEFTVSPKNAPGEILWSAPLGPDLNPYLSHLARMYNGYAGGFEVQVILAGNAFTAGKIIFAAVPPNFPTEGLSPSQVTMFPHIIVDVRQLEPVLIPLPDVRNNFYHYNQSNDSTIKLIAMLYTPLRANNAGDDVFTVSCRVLTRPSPDFDFIFLVPPTVEVDMASLIYRQLLTNSFTVDISDEIETIGAEKTQNVTVNPGPFAQTGYAPANWGPGETNDSTTVEPMLDGPYQPIAFSPPPEYYILLSPTAPGVIAECTNTVNRWIAIIAIGPNVSTTNRTYTLFGITEQLTVENSPVDKWKFIDFMKTPTTGSYVRYNILLSSTKLCAVAKHTDNLYSYVGETPTAGQAYYSSFNIFNLTAHCDFYIIPWSQQSLCTQYVNNGLPPIQNTRNAAALEHHHHHH